MRRDFTLRTCLSVRPVTQKEEFYNTTMVKQCKTIPSNVGDTSIRPHGREGPAMDQDAFLDHLKDDHRLKCGHLEVQGFKAAATHDLITCKRKKRKLDDEENKQAEIERLYDELLSPQTVSPKEICEQPILFDSTDNDHPRLLQVDKLNVQTTEYSEQSRVDDDTLYSVFFNMDCGHEAVLVAKPETAVKTSAVQGRNGTLVSVGTSSTERIDCNQDRDVAPPPKRPRLILRVDARSEGNMKSFKHKSIADARQVVHGRSKDFQTSSENQTRDKRREMSQEIKAKSNPSGRN